MHLVGSIHKKESFGSMFRIHQISNTISSSALNCVLKIGGYVGKNWLAQWPITLGVPNLAATILAQPRCILQLIPKQQWKNGFFIFPSLIGYWCVTFNVVVFDQMCSTLSLLICVLSGFHEHWWVKAEEPWKDCSGYYVGRPLLEILWVQSQWFDNLFQS